MNKVFIIDNLDLIGEGLKMILENESDLIVVGEAINRTEIMTKIPDCDCDILLLDMNLPKISGIEMIGLLKKLKPELPILAISNHPEDNYAIRVLKAGASGYICKDAAIDEVVTAIKKICLHGRYVSDNLLEQLCHNILYDFSSLPHEQLSFREQEILLLLASGKKTKDIADELKLSMGTVFNDRLRIFEKLKITNEVELAHYAISNRLIEVIDD